jgi:uncharacterized membrane protein
VSQNVSQSAGKLQLLDLAPLKARIGNKWKRLSTHLEKFFETAITRSLAPGDTYTRVNELSYMVLFRGLSIEETQLRCAAISQEICQRLFGEHSVEASLRNLVACFDIGDLPTDIGQINALDNILERCGKETIVSASHLQADPRLARPSSVPPARQVSSSQTQFLYRPVWDALNGVVVTYLCQPTALALALGALQFLTRKGGRIHRITGRIYVAGVFLAGPFAVWMASIISPGFLFAFTIVQAGIWMLCTGIAFWTIRRGNIDQHREWMMRSYAVVLNFLEGRVLMAIPVLAAAGLDAVVFVNWLSLTLTLIGVELVIQWPRLSARRRNSRGLPTNSAV